MKYMLADEISIIPLDCIVYNIVISCKVLIIYILHETNFFQFSVYSVYVVG